MYEKTNWQDRVVDPSTGEVIQEGTLISAGNLNHLENGVFQNSSDISTINGNVSTINNNISSINTSVAQNTSDISTNTEDIQDLSDHITTQDAANESKFDSIDTEIENIKKRLDPEPSPEPEPQKHVIYTVYLQKTSQNKYNASYYNNAASKSPAKLNDDGTYDFSDWKNCFFMPKPCMLKSDGTVDYYLNPNNYEEKEDGTPSDIYNLEYDGNAVMEFPLAWYYVNADHSYTSSPPSKSSTFCSNDFSHYLAIHISDYKVNDNYCCFPFMNENNEILKHIYISMFPSNKSKKSISIQDNLEVSASLYVSSNFDDNDVKKTMLSWSDFLYIKYLMIMIFGRIDETQLNFNLILPNGAKNKYGLFANSKQLGIQNLSCSALVGIFWSSDYNFYYKLCLGTSDGTSNPKYTISKLNSDNIKKADTYYNTRASSTAQFNGYCNKLEFIDKNTINFWRNDSNTTSNLEYTLTTLKIHYNSNASFDISNNYFMLFSPEARFAGLTTGDKSNMHVHFVIRPTSDSEKYTEESV